MSGASFIGVSLDTTPTELNPGEQVFRLILADDRMWVLFRDYIAQKVYDDIRSPTAEGAP